MVNKERPRVSENEGSERRARFEAASGRRAANRGLRGTLTLSIFVRKDLGRARIMAVEGRLDGLNAFQHFLQRGWPLLLGASGPFLGNRGPYPKWGKEQYGTVSICSPLNYRLSLRTMNRITAYERGRQLRPLKKPRL